MAEVKKPLHEIVDDNNFKIITSRILKSRKMGDNDTVTYEVFDQLVGDKIYTITPEHVPMDYLYRYAKSKCSCNGKGYYVTNIMKNKLQNAGDFVLLADRPINEMTDEQKKLYIEAEKKKTMWRVMLPCKCALTGAMKKEPDILANQTGNVVIRINYEVKDAEVKGETGVEG